jgi:heme/copper-type cytochrome/quinol oxidase subunit 2
MFKGRSVIEIMVLWFTFIVGFLLLAIGFTIAVIKFRNPEADTDRATDALFAAITLVLGALLGMLTVKGSARTELDKRPEEPEPHDVTERTD